MEVVYWLALIFGVIRLIASFITGESKRASNCFIIAMLAQVLMKL